MGVAISIALGYLAGVISLGAALALTGRDPYDRGYEDGYEYGHTIGYERCRRQTEEVGIAATREPDP